MATPHFKPIIDGWLSGTLEAAKKAGFDEFYRCPIDGLEAYLVEWYRLPADDAKRLVAQSLRHGLCVRGWRFSLTRYYQNGQRLIAAQRLHS